MASDRAAVRIVCVDGLGRILLLRWYDRVAGESIWEPPGGGIDGDETPLEAARRELFEETGLDGSAVLDISVPVDRDFVWHGTRHVKVEPFYLARFDGTPDVRAAALTAGEVETYRGHRWFTREELSGLDLLEPRHLLNVLADLGLPG